MSAQETAPIRIVEVGPRDGLQNEPRTVPLEAKLAYIDLLSGTGLQEIEAGAFVRPDRVPQMAGSEEVFRRMRRAPGVRYSALVPNEAGLERALSVRIDKAAVFTAASESFSLKNVNASIAESLGRLEPVIRRAESAALPLRGYVSTAFWCPYEGKIDPALAVETCRRLMDLGVFELSVGDTLGKASPDEVRAFLDLALKRFRREAIFLHFHDTYGRALENALCAWKEFGITGFDASSGGIGGCPFAAGSSGNVSTEELIRAFQAQGARVPADPEAVSKAAAALKPHIRARGKASP